jgi:uncharacterized protein (TIRG00374 family)
VRKLSGISWRPWFVPTIIGVAACWCVVTQFDLALLHTTFAEGDHLYTLLALIFCLAYIQLRGLRWWLLVSGSLGELDCWSATRISSLGTLMSGLYPGLGEATRALLLRRRSFAAGRVVGVVLQERMIDTGILGLVALGLLSSYWTTYVAQLVSELPWGVVLSGVSVSLVCLLHSGVREQVLPRAISRRFRLTTRVEKHTRRVLRDVTASWTELRRSPMLCINIVAASFAVHGVAVAAASMAMLAAGMEAPPTAALLLVTLVNLGLGLIPSPGGLGVFQAAGVIALGSFADSLEQAVVSATVLQATSYVALLLAALPSALFEFRKRHTDDNNSRCG